MDVRSSLRAAWPAALARQRWVPPLFGSLGVLFAASLVAYAVVDRPPVAVDPAFYQHVGWYVTRGAVPYVDVWDINPPLTFAVAAGLAGAVGGNLPLQHALAVAVSFGTVAAAVCLTGLLAFDLTGDDGAALAAGLVMLVPPEVYGLPPYGLRSQYFALLFGVLSLVLVGREHPLWAGASAAAAAGFWQPGGATALLVVGMALQRGGAGAALRAVAGGLAVAGLVALPFLAAGAFVPMVVQTVLAPFSGREPYTLLSRTYLLVLVFGYGTVLVPLSAVGWARSGAALREHWWVAAGALLYGLQMYLVNLNGSLDALLFLVFVAQGVALGVAAIPPRWRRRAVAAVVLLVVTGPAWHLFPAAPADGALERQYEEVDPDDNPSLVGAASVPGMRTIYWQKLRPDTCHYRLSHTELRWIEKTGARLDERRCGRVPPEVAAAFPSLS